MPSTTTIRDEGTSTVRCPTLLLCLKSYIGTCHCTIEHDQCSRRPEGSWMEKLKRGCRSCWFSTS